MKQLLSSIVLVFILVAGTGYSAGAQSVSIYVKVRPAPPVIVRTVAPSPHHVWVAEEWRPNGNSYVFAGGYWAAPPQPGWVWIPGHWKHHQYGEYWVAGHWRR